MRFAVRLVESRHSFSSAERPTVIVVIGVNGAGKTTFIGKLASRTCAARGRRVILAAADTFRAGAIDQLRVWAGRVGADFIGGQPGGDPASVAFDAIDAATTRGADVVIVDTAGRLHTSDSLMDELKKVVRVIKKRRPDAPHETLLVLDGTIGQNAVAQAKTFAAAVPSHGPGGDQGGWHGKGWHRASRCTRPSMRRSSFSARARRRATWNRSTPTCSRARCWRGKWKPLRGTRLYLEMPVQFLKGASLRSDLRRLQQSVYVCVRNISQKKKKKCLSKCVRALSQILGHLLSFR